MQIHFAQENCANSQDYANSQFPMTPITNAFVNFKNVVHQLHPAVVKYCKQRSVQAGHLSLNSHIARVSDKSDAKQILTAFPLGELEETTGTPPYYVDEDYPAGPGIIEPLPE